MLKISNRNIREKKAHFQPRGNAIEILIRKTRRNSNEKLTQNSN